MWSLIHWRNGAKTVELSTSVKRAGKITKIKWSVDGKFYVGRVLLMSDDREMLQTIECNSCGVPIIPVGLIGVHDCPEAPNDLENHLEAPNDSQDDHDPGHDRHEAPDDLENQPEVPDDGHDDHDRDHVRHDAPKMVGTTTTIMTNIRRLQMTFMRAIMMVISITRTIVNFNRHTEGRNDHDGDQHQWNEGGQNRIELLPRSGVYIFEYELESILTRQKSPRKMIRALMLEIIGRETLKRMTLTGKGPGRRAIPPQIVLTIKRFVQEKIPTSILPEKDFREYLTIMCKRLRQ